MTSWTSLALATLLALLAATAPANAAGATAQRLEVGFVSASGVALVVEIAASPRGGEVLRSGSWVFSAGGDVVVASAADAAPGHGLDAALPSPPAGVDVRYASDGGLLNTLTGLGDWQAVAGVEPLGGRAHPTSPGVADASDARLQVAPRPDEGLTIDPTQAGGLRTAPAVLYGTRGAVSGRAWVDLRPAPSARVVVLDDNGLIELPKTGDGVFIADVVQTCRLTTPSALSARMEDHASVRLLDEIGQGGCLLSGAAVVPLSGAWLERRTEKPAHGIAVVVREGQAAP